VGAGYDDIDVAAAKKYGVTVGLYEVLEIMTDDRSPTPQAQSTTLQQPLLSTSSSRP
jgi:hypothetical protein